MWLKVLIVLLLAEYIHGYINSQYEKSSYLNYELSRFRNRASTTTERSKYPWNKSYQNYKNVYPTYEHRIRHTNRFPKMDRLLNRMSNKKSADISEKQPATDYNMLKSDSKEKWVTENPYKRFLTTISPTTTTVSNEELEAYFGEDEDQTKSKTSIGERENNENEADEDDEDADEDEDDNEDESDEEDESEDWQAEEPTEEPTERSLTEYKWKHYGTRARVEESRKNMGHMNMRHGVAEAVEHARRVNVLGACREPRPRLIRVQSVYPDTGKAYIPHCTLLHRCADDTGCCRSHTLTCAPKTQVAVHLHFYTGRPGAYTVEQLAFYNHTDCHCVERTTEMMARDAAIETSEDRYPLKPAVGTQPQDMKHIVSAPEPIRRCKCPDLFISQIIHGQCRCDCEDGNRDCIRIRRGKEYFSLKDRLCIQKGECGYPACEFGVYIRFSGRCPRKQEKLDAFSRVQPQ